MLCCFGVLCFCCWFPVKLLFCLFGFYFSLLWRFGCWLLVTGFTFACFVVCFFLVLLTCMVVDWWVCCLLCWVCFVWFVCDLFWVLLCFNYFVYFCRLVFVLLIDCFLDLVLGLAVFGAWFDICVGCLFGLFGSVCSGLGVVCAIVVLLVGGLGLCICVLIQKVIVLFSLVVACVCFMCFVDLGGCLFG